MYVIIWKFAVRPGQENEFEAVYGPEGTWARFFRRGPGYIGTELLRDASEPGQYFTIDRWQSQAAFEGFMARFAAGYQSIDQECEAMTESETKIGTFESTDSEPLDPKTFNHDQL